MSSPGSGCSCAGASGAAAGRGLRCRRSTPPPIPASRAKGCSAPSRSTRWTSCAARGVDLIFNTPNANSRPGYLRMGWEEAAPLVPRTRLRLRGLIGLAHERVPASRWPEPTSAGVGADEAFADEARWADLLAPGADRDGLATDRSLAYLRWRYPAGLLGYRVLLAAGGAAVFRVRSRGRLVEATVCDLFGDPAGHRALLRSVLGETGADLLMTIGSARPDGLVRYPGGARRLVTRPLCADPALQPLDLRLTMGDVEVF